MPAVAQPTAQELQDRLDKAEARLAALKPDATTKEGDIVEGKQKGYTPKPSEVFGQVSARKGESSMTSRGWRIGRALQAMASGDWSHAKVEKSIHDLMANAFGNGCGPAVFEAKTILAPFGTSLLPDDMRQDDNFGRVIKSLYYAGVENADPDEMQWLAKKSYEAGTRKDLSWLDSSAGGAMVGPPQQGEFVDLLRNTSALTEAGATVIPLPPNGRIQYPKQTSASTGYWVGESTQITASQQGTGLITLSAKKCAGLTKIPNELIRYAGAAAEALVRMDLTKTLQLTFDLAGLEGAGGDTKPLGILNTPGIQTVTATTVPTSNTGAILAEGDIYKWDQQVEEANGQFQSFIMTPGMYYKLITRRTGGSTTGDGVFAFSPFRQLGDNVAQKNINGHKVVTSNQVNKTPTFGNASDKTIIFGGQMSDVLLAMFGALEFALGTQGDTAFAYDQTWVRAILIGDVGIKHPGTIAVMDKVQVQ
jgi:HK97 family phage major capsid protein